jgi:hypothetical protein
MTESISEFELQEKLLSIFNGIDETCRKVGSRLEPTAAGEVHFIDPENGEYKFRTHQLCRRSELLDAIRTGWIPCGFIVLQIVDGRRETHLGNFSWMKSADERACEECNRYLKERLDEMIKCIDAAGEASESLRPFVMQS